jgi:acyl carrier protein
MSALAPSRDGILLVLKAVLSEHFGLRTEQIVLEAHLIDDLDLDSIDWIDLAVRLEMETGQKLDESELTSLRTIQDVVDVVHRRLGAPGPTPA